MGTTKEKEPQLRSIQFGRLDASDEASVDPELLLRGYLDYRDSVYQISTGFAWYLLGPKGAGKSAVFEHLRLKWTGRFDRFFVPWDLRGFPVADVTQIKTGQTQGPSRTQSAWELLILLRIVQTLTEDNGLSSTSEFDGLKEGLKKNGLLVDDWKPFVSRWAVSQVSFTLPGIVGLDLKNEASMGPLELTAVIRRGLENVVTDSRHVICIDGLDSFFLETDDEWSSLAGLVHAIESVNRFMAKVEIPVSVVAAIRTEAFEALESTDSNKLKARSVYLDWSPSGAGATSALWKLVDTKVQAFHPTVKSFATTYLSADIGQGPYRALPDYFLAYTRLLPRDTIALLQHVQAVHPNAGQVRESEAVEAVRNYAEQYFVGEIANNLAGILDRREGRQEKTRLFFEAVKSVKMAEFTMHELQQDLDGELEEHELKRLLRQLFQIGGIGIRTRTSSTERTDFIYRKASPVAFNARRSFLLHNALVVAWNKARY